MQIDEVHFTDHFNKRVDDRVKNVVSVEFPMEFYKEGDDKPFINKLIKNKLKEEMALRLGNFKSKSFDLGDDYIVYKLGQPRIIKDGKTHKPIFKSQYNSQGDAKTSEGDLYVAIIYNDRAITLMLMNSLLGDNMLLKMAKDHLERRVHMEVKDVKLMSHPNLTMLIDLDEELKPVKKIDEPKKKLELPRKAVYRRGRPYTHPKFGKGRILSRKKVGDNLYNIDVEFPNIHGKKTLRVTGAN